MQNVAPSPEHTSQLTEYIGLIERHPTALLVLALAVACWWLARRVQSLNKEVTKLHRALWTAQDGGYEFDEDTTQILSKHDRRRTSR